ncbi:Bax inhibitor-1/YccA family protein [Sediminicurvatus halobius]|uniref:BAX inhibitor protein n=1 Tax=Sediminicurvatus halobius TaxID=2182432 RepID=A0A2U2N3S1_9GAMM|nr:Bax inhibitor-1/YccA family protein [Spiribacter halobius]PWG63743.1 BAX inhibitor protein [Spiribacter halobius]UEX76224.1 Bax inhibitor-1/YccA family protein [Spiribacter halobius]
MADNFRVVQSERAASARTGTGARESVLSTNKVLRNTYALLAMTLIFSGVTAGVAMATNAPPLHWILVLGGYFGLLFLTSALRNSVWGLPSVFALTGFMGYTLGPLLNMYIGAFSNGAELVMMALGGTGVMFIGLSAYALTTQKDFSFLRGFLFAGILVAFVGALVAVIFSIPALSMAMSAAFIVLMSALILYQTSEIIHGGETNYIMATITLYVSIYNLFTSLLHLLGVFAGEE